MTSSNCPFKYKLAFLIVCVCLTSCEKSNKNSPIAKELTTQQKYQFQEKNQLSMPSRGRYQPRISGCESGHWIQEVLSGGEIIILEDGSVWKVDSLDTIDSALWLPISDIIACDDKLINTDDKESVGAIRIR